MDLAAYTYEYMQHTRSVLRINTFSVVYGACSNTVNEALSKLFSTVHCPLQRFRLNRLCTEHVLYTRQFAASHVHICIHSNIIAGCKSPISNSHQYEYIPLQRVYNLVQRETISSPLLDSVFKPKSCYTPLFPGIQQFFFCCESVSTFTYIEKIHVYVCAPYSDKQDFLRKMTQQSPAATRSSITLITHSVRYQTNICAQPTVHHISEKQVQRVFVSGT